MWKTPPGRRVVIGSALTGRPIEYFVPYPLGDILHHTARHSSGFASTRNDDWVDLAYLFVLMAKCEWARNKSSSGGVKYWKAVLVSDSRLGREGVLALAAEKSASAKQLRTHTVFSGGSAPSTANWVFPPPVEVPALFDTLVEVIDRDGGNDNGFLRACLVLYFVCGLHPFEDGNGRFSRSLSLYASRRSGCLADGVVLSLIPLLAHGPLVGLWRRVRYEGLEVYVEPAYQCVQKFFEVWGNQSHGEDLSGAARELCSAVGSSAAITIMAAAAGPGIDSKEIRGLINCSQRKASGLFDLLVRAGGELGGQGVVVLPWHSVEAGKCMLESIFSDVLKK